MAVRKAALTVEELQALLDDIYLLLDQSTPQDVVNGAPTFNVGLKITSGYKLIFDA